jgi:hypothetical protein
MTLWLTHSIIYLLRPHSMEFGGILVSGYWRLKYSFNPEDGSSKDNKDNSRRVKHLYNTTYSPFLCINLYPKTEAVSTYLMILVCNSPLAFIWVLPFYLLAFLPFVLVGALRKKAHLLWNGSSLSSLTYQQEQDVFLPKLLVLNV